MMSSNSHLNVHFAKSNRSELMMTNHTGITIINLGVDNFIDLSVTQMAKINFCKHNFIQMLTLLLCNQSNVLWRLFVYFDMILHNKLPHILFSYVEMTAVKTKKLEVAIDQGSPSFLKMKPISW